MSNGRRGVVTAGAAGIGLAIAKAFAAIGDRHHVLAGRTIRLPRPPHPTDRGPCPTDFVGPEMPALLISTSMPPSVSTASLTKDSTEARLDTSQTVAVMAGLSSVTGSVPAR